MQELNQRLDWAEAQTIELARKAVEAMHMKAVRNPGGIDEGQRDGLPPRRLIVQRGRRQGATVAPATASASAAAPAAPPAGTATMVPACGGLEHLRGAARGH